MNSCFHEIYFSSSTNQNNDTNKRYYATLPKHAKHTNRKRNTSKCLAQHASKNAAKTTIRRKSNANKHACANRILIIGKDN